MSHSARYPTSLKAKPRTPHAKWLSSAVIAKTGETVASFGPEPDGPGVAPHMGVCQAQQVDCGWEHSLVIADKGQLFAFGAGKDGRLGVGLFDDFNRPTPVDLDLEPVASVSCGRRHSVAVLVSGKVLTTGFNTELQLGTNDPERRMPRSHFGPVMGPMSTHATMAAGGGGHTVVCTRDGSLYTWGRGSEGQLGRTPGTAEGDQFYDSELEDFYVPVAELQETETSTHTCMHSIPKPHPPRCVLQRVEPDEESQRLWQVEAEAEAAKKAAEEAEALAHKAAVEEAESY